MESDERYQYDGDGRLLKQERWGRVADWYKAHIRGQGELPMTLLFVVRYQSDSYAGQGRPSAAGAGSARAVNAAAPTSADNWTAYDAAGRVLHYECQQLGPSEFQHNRSVRWRPIPTAMATTTGPKSNHRDTMCYIAFNGEGQAIDRQEGSLHVGSDTDIL